MFPRNYFPTCLHGLSIAFVLGLFVGVPEFLRGQEAKEKSEPSYVRIGDAKFAEAIKLTDEQRAKIASLLTARAEALGQATAENRPQVLAQSEKDLAAVLTDEQKAQFLKVASEVKLRFNFRFQRWEDVLEWYAKQADLSLTLDAPPPGTFNYSDAKEYTPVEAMDLLNGVLSTKGYTLIRSGRMLIVIDLQEGVPEGLIPKISVDELEKRGKFELVTVMFPLGGRDPQAVKTEVTPLLGQYGKSVLLPQTKQLVVTDTAGIVRAVSAVISSIPEPSSPPAAAKAIPPVLGVYPINGADAKVAEEVLTKMFPQAKIAADVKAEQVNAFATPAEQEAIKGVIEKMKDTLTPDKKPRLEVYPVGSEDPVQLRTNLTLVAPTARITFDDRERQLVVFGTATDQENIKAAIAKLGTTAPIEKTRQMEIYRLTKADPSSTMTLLQGMLPAIKVSMDPQTRRLIVVASPDDHKAITAILVQLQSTEPGADTQVLRFYPLENPLPANALTVFNSLAPKAQISANNEAKQLQVLASLGDQETIKTNLDILLKGLPVEKRKLVSYPVNATQKARFTTLFPTLLTDYPDIRMVPESEPGEIGIWARPSQHVLLKGIIESLVSDVPDGSKSQLMIHPYRQADPSAAMAALRSLAPDAKVSLDSTNRNLVAIASPQDQKIIQSTIEKLQPGDQGPDAPILRLYQLEGPLPATTLSVFTRIVPKATVTPDPQGKWLQVIATAADQETIKNNLDILLKEVPNEKRKLVSYPVNAAQKARFTALFPTLLTDYPEIRQVPESEPGEIGIWAKPSQHELLKGIIASLVSEVPDGSKTQLMTHPYRQADPSAAMVALRSLAPDAKVSLDSTNRNLVAIASPQDQKIIQSTIEKLQPGDQGPDAPVLRFYQLEGPLPATTLSVFTRIIPKATVTPDPQGKWLQVVATAADQALVKSTLEDLTKGLPVNEKRKLTVYTVTPIQKTRFQTLQPSLVTDFPDVRIVPDSEPTELAIWAKPSEHAVLKGLIESLVTDVPEGDKPSLISHPIKYADATTLLTVLKGLVPDAKVSIDSLGRNLVAIASPDSHAVIKSTIDKLQVTDMGKDTQVLRFYPLEQQLPPAALNAFAKIAPKATVTQDPDGRWLQVVASPPEHELIKSNLEEQFKGMPLTEKRKLKVYIVSPSQRVRFQSIMPSLVADLPEIRVVADSGPNELAIWAKPTQHDTLKSILDELKREIPENEKNHLRSYPLKFADPSIAAQVLQNLFPGVKINVDSQTSRLQIWARAADHIEIKQAIDEIDGDKTNEKQDKVSVYPLPDVDLDVAVNMLQQVLPKIRVMKDVKARAIVAWGKKTDHDVIARTLETMKDSADNDQKPRLKIYPAGKINAQNMLEVLKVTFPGAKLAVDTKTGGLAAMATASEHDEIQSAITQMMSQAIGESGRFTAYQLLKTEREVATAVLKLAVPEAGISSGKDPTQLLIWARPADHVIIERVIKQLESESAPNKGFELKVYTVKSAPASVVHPLIGRTVPKCTVTMSSDPNRLIIYALPSDHVEIAKIVKQFDAENTPETTIEVYDVQKTDADSALRMVQTMLQKQGASSTVNLIPGTHQLFVEARPEQQDLVRSVLTKLRSTNDSSFEAFQLDLVDTSAAESMVRKMFSGTTKPPMVEADGTLQKLYVRGTKEQLTRVREMLEKMGEGGLANASAHSGHRFRVIPFTGDSAAAVEEIQKIWSKLRPNDLKVVPPAGGANSRVLSPRIGIEMTPEEPENQPTQKPLGRPLNKRNRSKLDGTAPEKKDETNEIESGKDSSSAREKPMLRVALRDVPLPDDGANQQNDNEAEAKSKGTEQSLPTGETKNTPPVVVLPRDGNVTIMSDDTEALEQLDKLIRALSTPTESGGKTFMVYSLKFAGATSVAETIRQSLRIQSGSGSRSGGSAPTVVADERLNAIVVHANRNDRAAIEKLIETLDSSDIPEALAANRPRRVRVKYASATQIMDVLRLVYKQQLSTGGGRKEVPIPAGLAPEIAALIQQMNASNTGPLLSLSVDQVSNSIVIMAPRSLADQVEKLIEDLDQASVDEEAHSMNIIPTRRMNSTRMQKILNHIMDKSKKRP